MSKSKHSSGWVGVDLDGTLAHYDHWRGVSHVGEPIVPMLRRVKQWLADGRVVRIFTARVAHAEEAKLGVPFIEAWCKKHVGRVLSVTALKDMHMIELWDDRAVQIECNTGRRMDNVPDPEHWTP